MSFRKLYFAFILAAISATAMDRAQGWCEQGNKTITVHGQTSSTTTPVQRSYPSCTVTVYITGSSPLALATIFSTNTGTGLGNPFTADTTGYWAFYAVDGTYDVKFSGAGIPTPFTQGAHGSIDPVFNSTTSGYVPRTKNDKLSDFVNVKDFGAICNGTTDDHAAIQTAITAVSAGGTLNFPPTACNLGTVGLIIPVTTQTNPGIVLQGQGFSASTLIYTGTGAAVTIGTSGSFTYRSGIKQMGINLTGAGTSAIGLNIFTCLYCLMDTSYIYSAVGSSSNQVGLKLGGGVQGQLFGAYFQWRDSEIVGDFKRGVYMTGQLSWGFNASQFIGGAIVGNGARAGTAGVYMEQGNENLILNMDVENFAVGYEIHSYDNSLNSARSEGNTIGIILAAASGDCCAVPTSTTGGTFTRMYQCFFGDGITDNSGGNSEWHGTLNAGNVETRLRNNSYLDTTLNISGNYPLKWTAAAGGSSGLFWFNGGNSAVASIATNGTTVHHQQAGADVIVLDPTNGLTISQGIYRNSPGFQHIEIPAANVCSTANTLGANCSWTITWNTAFVDTNYTVVCSIRNVTAGSPYLQVTTKSATQTVGNIVAGTAAVANGGFDCIAVHW